jgi:hypothetical protein
VPQVPDFGSYIKEGREGGGPKFNGKVRFTASQTRYWIEYGTLVMEELRRSSSR